MRLTEIWIYPVKSLGGIRLKSTRVLGKGLEFDRRYMLIDENGVAITQREFPAMALFKTSIDEERILIRYQSAAIEIPLTPDLRSGSISANVWGDMVLVHELGTEYSEWFSTQLGTRCRLVFFPEKEKRPVDPKYQRNGENVSLADAYPILVIGQSSLDDLNARLQEPVPMNRFRPNFVFTGGDAFSEDQWKLFEIGACQFTGVKPCARCTIPTINQDTAQKSAEPLRTLNRYRSGNNKVYFGQNVMVLSEGTVSEGDAISLIENQTQMRTNAL